MLILIAHYCVIKCCPVINSYLDVIRYDFRIMIKIIIVYLNVIFISRIIVIM